jgi:hypothetical protein
MSAMMWKQKSTELVTDTSSATKWQQTPAILSLRMFDMQPMLARTYEQEQNILENSCYSVIIHVSYELIAEDSRNCSSYEKYQMMAENS